MDVCAMVVCTEHEVRLQYLLAGVESPFLKNLHEMRIVSCAWCGMTNISFYRSQCDQITPPPLCSFPPVLVLPGPDRTLHVSPFQQHLVPRLPQEPLSRVLCAWSVSVTVHWWPLAGKLCIYQTYQRDCVSARACICVGVWFCMLVRVWVRVHVGMCKCVRFCVCVYVLCTPCWRHFIRTT